MRFLALIAISRRPVWMVTDPVAEKIKECTVFANVCVGRDATYGSIVSQTKIVSAPDGYGTLVQ